MQRKYQRKMSNHGYIDDFCGWDYVDNDNNPMDDHEHGTEIAGVAAAATNNDQEGIAGVCWNCRLMNIKVGYSMVDFLPSITYAVDNGAHILNNSYRSDYDSNRDPDSDGYYQNGEQQVVQCATGHEGYGDMNEEMCGIFSLAWGDILFVAGAGNDNKNLDTEVYTYPAELKWVLTAGGTTSSDSRWSGSNYGSTVEVGAPGSNITSTTLGHVYTHGQVGTSYSTAYVSGLAGLLLSQYFMVHPEVTELTTEISDEIFDIITNTADDISAQNPDVTELCGQEGVGSCRINAYNAISAVPIAPTPTPTDRDRDGHPHSHGDRHRDAHRHRYRDHRAHRDSHCHRYGYRDPHADRYTHPNRDHNSHPHAHRDADFHQHCHPDARLSHIPARAAEGL